jgi:hypothetical protein
VVETAAAAPIYSQHRIGGNLKYRLAPAEITVPDQFVVGR